MSKRFHRSLTSIAVAVALAAPAVAHADAAKDLQVLGRALTFLENGPTGRTSVGVVFDPSKPASVAEKDAVMAVLGGGFAAGAVTLVGTPVPVAGVGGSSASVLYVTSGVNYGAVGAAAKAKKALTVRTGSACVSSGGCVVGVTTQPKVEIIVNRAAASAVGATFKAAFRMMIKEI